MNNLILKELIEGQVFCPRCSANWHLLEDSLYEGIDSGNYEIAKLLMKNCRICQIKFKEVIGN